MKSHAGEDGKQGGKMTDGAGSNSSKSLRHDSRREALKRLATIGIVLAASSSLRRGLAAQGGSDVGPITDSDCGTELEPPFAQDSDCIPGMKGKVGEGRDADCGKPSATGGVNHVDSDCGKPGLQYKNQDGDCGNFSDDPPSQSDSDCGNSAGSGYYNSDSDCVQVLGTDADCGQPSGEFSNNDGDDGVTLT